ncbi:MAG: hypothetical protein N2Z79_01065, partial [Candidatus Omnitrophica bacterium]|nr:hypothetical protein [Candidatus Omnitrophota bacterium]
MVAFVKSCLQYEIFDLGRIDFISAYDFQKEIFLKVKNHTIDSAIIFCEHNPVITIGRASKDFSELLVSREDLKKKNIQIYQTDRGGKITYHGPGQLVVYFIFDLDLFNKDLHYFLKWLQKIGAKFIAKFGIYGYTPQGLRG